LRLKSDAVDEREINALREQLQRISAEERELWTRVSGKYPGQTGHSPELWARWLDVAQRMRAVAKMIRDMP